MPAATPRTFSALTPRKVLYHPQQHYHRRQNPFLTHHVSFPWRQPPSRSAEIKCCLQVTEASSVAESEWWSGLAQVLVSVRNCAGVSCPFHHLCLSVFLLPHSFHILVASFSSPSFNHCSHIYFFSFLLSLPQCKADIWLINKTVLWWLVDEIHFYTRITGCLECCAVTQSAGINMHRGFLSTLHQVYCHCLMQKNG